MSSRWAQGRAARLGLLVSLFAALACVEVASNLASAPGSRAARPSATPPDDALTRERNNCLALLGADRWQAQGFRGQGVKIAILDSGFRNYRDFLGKGLPAQVEAKSFRRDGDLEARDSQHGILCGEVIHAIAPDTQIVMANWEPEDPASFIEAVRWAKKAGARILSCSLIMPNWSDGEGGGQIHEALARLLGKDSGPSDLLFFASAGNTAQRHWTGTFEPNKHGFHQWAAGRTINVLKPWGTDRVAVEIYGPTKYPCELEILEEGSNKPVGKMNLQRDLALNWGQAVVRFDPAPGQNYLVRLKCLPEKKDLKNVGKFHLVALGAYLEETAQGGSIPFPGDGAGVVAVGAVDRAGKRLLYSSCGPNSSAPKPDFVGLVPFPSFCRERPFAGTSAAAPEAASLAALVWSRHPDWTPGQVRATLKSAALDLAAPGHDCETGYGMIRLP